MSSAPTLLLLIAGVLMGCRTPEPVVANQCTENRRPGPPLRAFATRGDSVRVTVLDAEVGDLMHDALVSVGLDGNRMGITDATGTTRLPAIAGDTLRIAFIAYHTEWVVVPDGIDSIIVALEPCILTEGFQPP